MFNPLMRIFMQRNHIDLARGPISGLFKIYFMPTLIGMLSICGVTAIDGIFIGHGVGSDGLAAVNICFAPLAAFTGIGLMLGVGASVISAMALAQNDVSAARLHITQALLFGTILVLIFLFATLFSPTTTGRLLGSSPTLMPLVQDYMVWMFPAILFQLWEAIGLFVVRLDGSPKYAMWCNLVPAILNIILDYLFVFPLDMGLKGAAIATFIATAAGGVMTIGYIGFAARTLRLAPIKTWGMRLFENLWSQCQIGVSALLGEVAIGIVMFLGNILFMRTLGDEGVGAFSIACYYMPFVFMVGNAIAQSAQPIISYNHRLGEKKRVRDTERLALCTALACGAAVTLLFVIFPDILVSLFLGGNTPTVRIATTGLPLFAVAFVPFVFNLTAIGYFQAVEQVRPTLVFALLRGAVFLIPAFIGMAALGVQGLWLSLAVSEILTALWIIVFYIRQHRRDQCH